MKKLLLMSVAMTCLILTSSVRADIVLSLEQDVQTPAGSSVTVIGSIADTTGNAVLSTYNIPIDIGSNGPGLPAGISNVTAASSNPAGLTNFMPQFPPAAFNFEAALSDSGAGLTLSSTPINLFTLTFDVDSSVPVGTLFDVVFQNSPTVNGGALPGAFNFTIDGTAVNSIDLPNFVVNQGQVEVVAAIPEPISVLPLILCTCMAGFRRKR